MYERYVPLYFCSYKLVVSWLTCRQVHLLPTMLQYPFVVAIVFTFPLSVYASLCVLIPCVTCSFVLCFLKRITIGFYQFSQTEDVLG